ncbi:MAG: helix-turn-helix domain-containing protein [Pseudonocardiaceae bacterium]
MSSTHDTPGPGKNVAILRKQRDMSQVKLARAAGVSLSLLSKIEVGDRALCQGVAAALARAMGITLDEVLGKVRVEQNNEMPLNDLRSAIRRFDLPGEAPDTADNLNRDLADVIKLRGDANLTGVLQKLPPWSPRPRITLTRPARLKHGK